MKKGYKRLLFFEILIFILLLSNSFISSILTNYIMIIFLAVLLIIFKIFFGFEKKKRRYVKDIIIEIVIVTLSAFILYYLTGLVIGFVQVKNYYTFNGIKDFIFPIIVIIALKEILRYQMINKAEGSKLLFVTTCILFITLDLTQIFTLEQFETIYGAFIFIAIYLLPTISNNVAASYIAKKVGYLPNILWLSIAKLYIYLIPIIPDSGEYIESLISLLFPLVLMYLVFIYFKKEADEQSEEENKKTYIFSVTFVIAITVTLAYFTSGLFHYWVIAIGTGSMTPKINPGDAVVIEKVADDYEFEVGEVIAYKYHGIMVVHRLNKIENYKDEYFYYTKGDANKDVDNYPVKRDMIVGVVNKKIPYIGLPSKWFNKL